MAGPHWFLGLSQTDLPHQKVYVYMYIEYIEPFNNFKKREV